MRFICEKIEVIYDQEDFTIRGFIWRNREYRIVEIISAWQDWKFPSSLAGKRTWLQRHHRNYFTVKTDTSEIFEIYLDRKGNKREWILSKKL